jgi:hypothetical protein
MIGFVIVYTVGAWLSFLLHCTPMEADWTGEGTCYSREIFVPVALTNTGKPHKFEQHIIYLLTFTSFEHFYRCMLRHFTYPHHMASADVTQYSTQPDWCTESWLHVSLQMDFSACIPLPDSSAVALGIVKASYQVKVDPDKMFTKHLNVFGL